MLFSSLSTRDQELSRLDRDTLFNVITTRPAAIQHAAACPASNKDSWSTRKTFSQPLKRAMEM